MLSIYRTAKSSQGRRISEFRVEGKDNHFPQCSCVGASVSTPVMCANLEATDLICPLRLIFLVFPLASISQLRRPYRQPRKKSFDRILRFHQTRTPAILTS